jgi:hypothetical protein
MSAATQALQRHTRRPTGKPSWPIILLAGAEKSGKSWSCAEASGTDLIGRTLWVGIGEDDPDEYGNIPGADFEIITHDGTYRDILAAIEWATSQPTVDGKPTLLVVDSMTRLWDLLCDMAQYQANARARRKQQNPTSKSAAAADDVEADIHMDLWNVAKGRWANVLDVIRAHQGPTLLTARLEEVTVMVGGKPTQNRELKVKAEKSLPYDVGGIVQMPERGKAFLTGVRTTRMQVPERVVMPGFTVEKLWRQLGLAEVESGERHQSAISHGPALRAVDSGGPDRPPTGQAEPTSGLPTVEYARAHGWTPDQLAEALARRAPAVTDLDALRAAVRATPPAIQKQPVQRHVALTQMLAAGLPADDRALTLGEWLTACGTTLAAGASVDALVKAAPEQDPWAVDPTDSDEPPVEG